MTLEERRAAISHHYRRLARSPAMGVPTLEELWPAGLAKPTPHGQPDPEWSDDDMDRIDDVINNRGV